MTDLIASLNSSIRFDTKVAALDSIVIECQDEWLGETVDDSLSIIRARLSQLNFSNYKQEIVAKCEYINILRNHNLPPSVRLLTSNYTKDYVYILTVSAGGRLLIHPPYKEDHSIIMSWDEYFSRLAAGEKLNVFVVAPWAQARIRVINEPKREWVYANWYPL